MANEDTQTTGFDEVILQGEITSIYAKLSVDDDFDFDAKEEAKFVEDCIDKCYDCDFKLILTEDLQENDELINKTFVELLKMCVEKNFKKVGQIYISYCDYFDLEYDKTFNKLHEKLQKLIKNATKILIGNSTYSKYVKKSNIHKPPVRTLFDMVKNKNT